MMREILDTLLLRMAEYEKGCPKRLQHLLKVHAFAALIGRQEKLDEKTQDTLEIAAILHDIGIKPSIEKFGSGAGPYQEKEGPAFALEMMKDLPVPEDMQKRICYLIAHHHTYFATGKMDLQILWEADFLVNLYEGNEGDEAVKNAYNRIFRTACGRQLMRDMFGMK